MFEKALNKQVKTAISAVRGGNRRPKIAAAPMKKAYDEAYRDVFMLFAGTMFNELEKAKKDFSDAEISEWTKIVNQHLAEEGSKRIVLINDTTREWITRTMQNAIEQGLSIQKVAKEMTEKWQDMAKFRAERIARTEIISASNFGSQQGAKSTGLALRKKWLSTPDGRTRTPPDSKYNHVKANGQTRDLDKPYVVSGEALKYPGDPSGSAGNVVNCRCTEIYEVL